jgi:hypothetical protein
MGEALHAEQSIEDIAHRLAALLTSEAGSLGDPTGSQLVFEESLVISALDRSAPPPDVWAVDGGQALVADARCVQVFATRAARVRWMAGRTVIEEEGPLRAHLLGLGENRRALAALDAPVQPDSPVDVNLLRDWQEWSTVARCVRECQAGGMVLVDGDLQPDWRIPSWWLDSLLDEARARGVWIVGVTKHTSLSRGGAPLLGILERQAAQQLYDRACWWVPVARTRPDVGPGIAVTVARLDPDARYSFRVDLPGDADPEMLLGSLAGLCDDAAFAGYPFPLSTADRLAACPRWVKDEVWDRIAEALDQAGVPADVCDRAFADRHRMMERA